MEEKKIQKNKILLDRLNKNREEKKKRKEINRLSIKLKDVEREIYYVYQ